MSEPAAVPDDLLTADEHAAIRMAGDLAVLLARVVGNGPSRAADIAELFASVHDIQARLMAQAAARAYPGRYRLMGESL